MISLVKGSTLIETIIAMVITLSSFAIVSMIILKQQNYKSPSSIVQCEIILSGLMEKIKREKLYIDWNYKKDQFLIQQTITKYKEAKGLHLISLTATDGSGNQVAKIQELIIEE